MKARNLIALLSWIALSPALPNASWSQDPPQAERGFQPERSYDLGEIDHVNNFNGNLVVSVPIGQTYRVSPQLQYRFMLTWNSNLWDQEPDQSTGVSRSFPNQVSNAGAGWYFGLGRLVLPGQPGGMEVTPGYPMYVGPDGRKVQFWDTLHPDDPEDSGDNYLNTSSPATLYSRDSSYLRMTRIVGTCPDSGQPAICDWWLDFPNGVREKFRHDDGMLVLMTDRFGNQVTSSLTPVDSTHWTWTVTDPFRSHTIDLSTRVIALPTAAPKAQLATFVDAVHLAAFDGTTADYAFHYSLGTTVIRPGDLLQADCANDISGGDPCQVQTTFLDSVTGPAGWSLAMPSYETALDPSPGLLSGVLERLQLPTGGGIGWTYQLYRTPTGAEQVQEPKVNFSVGVATRSTYPDSGTTPEGTWTYAAQDTGIIGKCSLGAPAKSVWRTVTTPLGHRTTRYFIVWPCGTSGPSAAEFGLPYSADPAQDDPASGAHLSEQTEAWDSATSSYTLVRSTYIEYEWDSGAGINLGDPRNQRPSYTKTVYHDDSNRWQDVAYSSFDGLGHYRQSSTNGNFDAGNVHTSLTNYNPGQTYPGSFDPIDPGLPWLIGLYDRIDETESSDTSRRLYVFDSPFDPGNPQPALATGFLDCVRTLATGTTKGAHDLLTRYTLGNDVDGHSGYVTQERSYGGDRQSIGTSGACSDGTSPEYTINHTYRYGARKSSQSAGVSWKSLDFGIDANTGQPAQSFDPAGMETDFEYDALGRMIESRPLAKSGFSKDAWTKYEYVLGPGSSVTTRTCLPGVAPANCDQTSDLTRQIASIDGLGRVWKEQTLLPSGSLNKRITTYDAMGHKSTDSAWVADGASANHVTTYSTYDPFGRPASVTAPDGKITSFTRYGDSRVETQQSIALALNGTESPVTRKETYDRQGRLFRVEEQSNPAAPSAYIATDYSYDEAGHLVKVCQNASGSTCGQTRLFAYDNRGYLTSETHPEKGASGNGPVFYKTYDSRGHVWQRRDGVDSTARELDFTFDAAERLLSVKNSGGTILKQFTYDNATGAGAGKLATALRRNDLTLPNLFSGTKNYQVTETYEYSGRMGRASKRTTRLSVAGVNQERWELSQGYDELGAVTSIDYPRCFDATCGTGSETPARTISFTRTHGALTAVPGWATSITYHPNLLVASVTHANDTVDTIANDPNSIPRPYSMTIDPGESSDPNVVLGPYAYDGAGNVKSIGSSGGTDLFQYDKVSRVVKGQMGSLSPSRTQSYTFDLYGNVTSTTTDGSTVNTPVALVPPITGNPINRLEGASYDAAGNQTSWNGQSYTFDLFNMMKALDTGSEHWGYVYTADDERLIALLDSAANPLTHWTVRGLGNEVLTRDEHFPAAGSPPPLPPESCPGPNGIFCDDFEEGTVGAWSTNSGLSTRSTTDYIYRDGQLLAATGLNGEDTRNYSLDHLGTPRVITDDVFGSVIATHTYFPFGQEATATDQDAEPMKFTGHERDLQTTSGNTSDDLDYLHARFKSPLTARFLSPDQVGGGAGRPGSWNRYSYAHGNPLRLADPDGRVVVGFTGLSNNVGGVTQVVDTLIPHTSELGPVWLFRHQDQGKAVTQILMDIQRQPDKIVAVFGHSLGGAAALATVQALSRSAGAPTVDLLVTIDAVTRAGGRGDETVPSNVKTAINFFERERSSSGIQGTILHAADPSATKVYNIQLGVGHTGIDEAVAQAIVSEITNQAEGGDPKLAEGLQFVQGELIYVSAPKK